MRTGLPHRRRESISRPVLLSRPHGHSILQQRLVDLPPGLTIVAQVLLGVVAGAMGLIFAAPLTAAAMVMVQMWYVQDALGDR